ncbi:hypothetical protein M422DRAFT_273899 [Sphaerobolus stellatus SS14]|uniref:Uncharacterized protein n=1 Tax=Sphaerobolus stellatus (strain SS14) TaxID=990650 RepID=A0A0C9UIE3_SPHS4|nr:hypothetical protein M422DRAFT_273899 [Sphaerobolus stellatus SS14]
MLQDMHHGFICLPFDPACAPVTLLLSALRRSSYIPSLTDFVQSDRRNSKDHDLPHSRSFIHVECEYQVHLVKTFYVFDGRTYGITLYSNPVSYHLVAAGASPCIYEPVTRLLTGVLHANAVRLPTYTDIRHVSNHHSLRLTDFYTMFSTSRG